MRYLVSLTAALLTSFSLAVVPQGYPADYQKTVDAGQKEGRLVIYAATDYTAAKPLIDDFKLLYPGINVEYNDLSTTQVYNRYISEAASGTAGADLVLSSAMELQVKLATDGYALPYTSPETKNYAPNSHLDNLVYGFTLEPAVLVYNKRLVKPGQVPSTRADFAKLLQTGNWAGKVAAFDPEKSAVGFTLLHFDYDNVGSFKALLPALGKAQVGLYSSSGAMLEKVVSGEHAFAYDIIGSYALERQRSVPDLGVKQFKDGTIAFQRTAFIAKSAPHPNSARLFLDYLLSRRGQLTMANKSLIYALRDDVAGTTTPKVMYGLAGGKANVQVIPVSRDLLKNLDPGVRNEFFKAWRAGAK